MAETASEDKVKILAISASTVADGHVEQMLSIFCTQAFSLGADVEIVRLVEMLPPPVSGRLEGWEPDPFWEKKIGEADAVVIATPTHWFAPPAILKAWIDNLTPLVMKSGSDLVGKFAGIMIYAPEGGGAMLAGWFALVLNNIGFTIPADGVIWQEGPYKKAQNTWVYKAIPALAGNIIALVIALRSVPADASVFLTERVARYRARGGKKKSGLSALMELTEELPLVVEGEEPQAPPKG
jgi:multimeric flavodoxin WrbA